MSNKPGVMVYFDLVHTLEMLSDQEAGILFRAIMYYGMDGTRTKLPPNLMLLWPLIEMRINSDDARYNLKSQKKKYAVYVRWAKEHGQEPLSFNSWMAENLADEDEPLPLPI